MANSSPQADAEPSRPLLAFTMGDPAGVGPETIAGAWANPTLLECCRPVVIGLASVMKRAVAIAGVDARVHEIRDVDEAQPAPDVIPCLSVTDPDALRVAPATIDARGGEAAYRSLVAAARLAIDRRIAGLVTAPLHKAALAKAGYKHPGHTELLAELCGVRDFAMMLYLGPGEQARSASGLAIVHVTLHMSLRNVFGALTSDAILVKTRLAHQVMTLLKGSSPRVGVAALNPHAGEEGLFGDEEERIIRPAVELARGEGIDAQGPLPADTLIASARDGAYDAVVAMYHDQGHIAIKLLAMHRAVNVTLGLPIVRTSVAHGTAFDLAWQGKAETSGMVEAARVAAQLATLRAHDLRGRPADSKRATFKGGNTR